MNKKGNFDSLNVLILVLFVVFILLSLFFVFGAKYIGFASSNLATENIDSSNLDKGLLAYWQFNSTGKKGFIDSVSGRVLTGNAINKQGGAVFDGNNSLNTGCSAKCSGSPKINECGLFDSKESCSAFGGKRECSWNSVCSGNLDCAKQNDKDSCSVVPGCLWGGTNCYGSSNVSCSVWNSDKIGCLKFDSHSGNCNWDGPCKGSVFCDQLASEKDCSIVSGCIWVNGGAFGKGYCSGGVTGCSQWDLDKTGCLGLGYHSGQCIWDGPCKGEVTCESQTETKHCEAIPGCSVEASFPVSGEGSWSLFAWVKVSAKKGNSTLLGFGNTNLGGRGAYLKVDGAGKAFIDSGDKLVNSNVKVTGDSWHHVGGVFDGKTLAIYVDGKRAGDKKMSLNILCSGFSIGSENGVDNLKGEVDEVRLYDISLSDEKILEMYNLKLFSN